MAAGKGLTIKDVDLVFISAFDLGAKVNPRKLGEEFANEYPMVKARWHPPEKPRFTLHPLFLNHALFLNMINSDIKVLDPLFLEQSRYARFRLAEHEAEVVNPDIGKIVKKFKIEPYLLIHSAGIGVITAWINLKGSFTIDDIITFKNRLHEIELNIKDVFGNQYKSVTLGVFIDLSIAAPLRRMAKGWKELRDAIITSHVIVGVKEVKCGDRCFTAEDILKRHAKEVVGILTGAEDWREFRSEATKENLGKNLSYFEHSAMYLTIGASLFLSSPKLNKEIKLKVSKSPWGKDTEIRRFMLLLVIPVEFLMLSYKILDVYDSSYRKKRENLQERKRRGEVVNPSEYIELRSELTEALEEYKNVAFFKADPLRSILEYGKEVYRLREYEGVLRSALEELAELARTHYDEIISKTQIVWTLALGMFGFIATIGSFTALAQYYEKFVSQPWSVLGAVITTTIVGLIYAIGIRDMLSKVSPFRTYKGFGLPLQKNRREQKNTEAGSATPRKETEK
jgi:hypothetical protein